MSDVDDLQLPQATEQSLVAWGINVARELLGLGDEREVVAQATDFVLQLARVPAAGWLRAEGETGELFVVAGTERNRLEIRNRVAGRVGWSPQLQLELRERFASMIDVHVDQVQIFGQRDVLMLVPDLDAENRSTVESIADLADDAVGRLRDAASSEPNAGDVDEALAWLAHELRGPLVATRTALDSMISTNRSADEVLEPLRRVHDEVDSVVRMMGPMLSIASGAPMRSRPSDVTALVRGVARSASFEAGGRSLKVSVPHSLVLDVDPEVLRPALTNIVRNALAYSPPSAGVELRAREDDGHLVVDVSDHGPGLTAAERKAIFDRFVRGATGRNRPGAGLGLFIARRMVKTHGGSVDVESEEGVGTTFTVRVPIAQHARSLRPA